MPITTTPQEAVVAHLLGRRMPDVTLPSTDETVVSLSYLTGLTVLYIYPRTSPPGGDALPGWSDIPGAKGCTAQSCGYRDHYSELQTAGASQVFGLSTQDSGYQREVVNRLNLPFALLSDAAVGSRPPSRCRRSKREA